MNYKRHGGRWHLLTVDCRPYSTDSLAIVKRIETFDTTNHENMFGQLIRYDNFMVSVVCSY